MHWLADNKSSVRAVSVQTFYNLHCSPEIQADRGNGIHYQSVFILTHHLYLKKKGI